MDFRFTDEQLERRKQFFDVCRDLEKLRPAECVGMENKWTSDAGWAYHMTCSREFARRGWLSLGWPKEYGGQGDMMDRVLFAEARGYFGFGVTGVDTFGVQMLAPTLLAAGSEEIKREFLPMIAAGEEGWCQLWSEPNAGSDLAALTSTAIRKGDEYVLNGQKTWTTGAHRTSWGFGVFKTDLAAPKHRNMTFLLVDMKTPGITVRPIPYMNSTHIYNEVYFDDVHVPARLVGQENKGWEVVNTLAAFERSNISEIMGLQRHMEELAKLCNGTERNGRPLSKDPVVRLRLARIASEIEAAKSLAYRVADRQNRKEMTLMDASAVKVFTSDVAERLVSVAFDILGPYAAVRNSRWAPMHGIWENQCQENFMLSVSMGSNEIQKNILAWYGLGLPRMK